jgi:hypothetical protein
MPPRSVGMCGACGPSELIQKVRPLPIRPVNRPSSKTTLLRTLLTCFFLLYVMSSASNTKTAKSNWSAAFNNPPKMLWPSSN